MAEQVDNVFGDVDRSGVAPELVAYLERVGARTDMRALDEDSYDLLRVAAGQHLLEVGCGLGDDAREMARRAQPGGRVTAIDVSETMLGEARRRGSTSAGPPVEFLRADVRSLGFADAAFDGVRVERVLQHLADAETAVAEMVRVLRPGGRLVAIEPDWLTFFVDVADPRLVRRTTEHAFDAFVRETMGRELRRLLVCAGLRDVVVHVHAVTEAALQPARDVFPHLDERIPPESGLVPADVRDEWFAALAAADAAGAFIAGISMFVAGGTKP